MVEEDFVRAFANTVSVEWRLCSLCDDIIYTNPKLKKRMMKIEGTLSNASNPWQHVSLSLQNYSDVGKHVYQVTI